MNIDKLSLEEIVKHDQDYTSTLSCSCGLSSSQSTTSRDTGTSTVLSGTDGTSSSNASCIIL